MLFKVSVLKINLKNDYWGKEDTQSENIKVSDRFAATLAPVFISPGRYNPASDWLPTALILLLFCIVMLFPLSWIYSNHHIISWLNFNEVYALSSCSTSDLLFNVAEIHWLMKLRCLLYITVCCVLISLATMCCVQWLPPSHCSSLCYILLWSLSSLCMFEVYGL